MKDLTQIFGNKVFNDEKMKNYLSAEVYAQFKCCVNEFSFLSPEIGEEIALVMKEWAIENGATHFTHWFQPMTGITAQKHDSFLKILPNGKPIIEFSSKELIKGEPDASSFPSGGLRETFEARGYTAWDPTSYAFIKDRTLCIPTWFFSYSGEVLDEKTPLLRSALALNKQALRMFKLLGNTKVTKVSAVVGAEQEYFLIDKKMYEKRKDLIFCGCTLFGVKPVKGQVLEDHYFGSLKSRVSAFMRDLDVKLWELGIPAKTKHNEVAPAQHEFAQIHTFANTAVDQNQLVMELLKSTAEEHGMVCLLHEKPFDGINGSGKHNNWSLVTDTGINLLEPGKSPRDNTQFLVFLCAIIKAVDEYADLMRISIATPGNDYRLGAHEAPPAIVSIYVGEEIMKILETIENGEAYNVPAEKMNSTLELNLMPNFPKDNSDRNRTSPFAFTGNKFEFRMVSSSQSIAFPNTVLNTIVANTLKEFADKLENTKDFAQALNLLLSNTIVQHKKIIFNGNSYSEDWVEEAKRRNLFNFPTVPDAFREFLSKKNVQLFEKLGVLTKKELTSRFEVGLENYCKIKYIEIVTLLDMVQKEILPAATLFSKELIETIRLKSKLKEKVSRKYESEVLIGISHTVEKLYAETKSINKILAGAEKYADISKRASFYKTVVAESLTDMRKLINELEATVFNLYWPYPVYDDILYSV
ncbi:glutamine synthetase [Clostridia bacterium]|nr:glutamine synthetase [Clostridia bacterium]